MRFWARRQAHETLLHRWDVEAGLSLQTGTDGAVTADGVDEVVEMFLARSGSDA